MNERKDIIVRESGDEFRTFLVASAMQKIGVDVFSIVFRETVLFGTKMTPTAMYSVWGKFDAKVLTTEEIDKAVSEELKILERP